MNFSPISITFFAYLVVMVAVGLVAWRYTKNFNDYILGGRRLGAVVTALSVGASDMSGWLLMGLPGAVFLSGICESWIAIGLALGTLANWLIVAAPLRVYTETAHNALTLPDYFSHRFEDKSRLLRIISAVVILLFFAIYSASGMVASARLFEIVLDLPYSTALIFGTFATLAYVFLGGFLAVSWTDTIQAAMMCLALIIAPVAVMIDLGGFTATIEQVRSVDPTHLNMLQGQTFIGVISLLAWGLGYFGQPHILVRFMAAKNASVMPRACKISMIWLIFSLSGAVAAGFFGSAFFSAHPDLGSERTRLDRPSYRSCRQRRRDLDRYGPEQPGSLLSQLCLGRFRSFFRPDHYPFSSVERRHPQRCFSRNYRRRINCPDLAPGRMVGHVRNHPRFRALLHCHHRRQPA